VDKAIEAQLRRAAHRLEMRVCKSRSRLQHLNNRGLYQIVDYRNNLVGGASYELTHKDVAFMLARFARESELDILADRMTALHNQL